VRQLAADLDRGGLMAHSVDQFMAWCRQSSDFLFEPLQQSEPFRGGQHVEGQLRQLGYRGMQPVEGSEDLLPAIRKHVRMISAKSDLCTRVLRVLWMNAQLWINAVERRSARSFGRIHIM
jgi:hypothetical protein